MEFALQSNAGSYEEILAWARFAESEGLAAFAIPDHFLRGAEHEPMLDALVQLIMCISLICLCELRVSQS